MENTDTESDIKQYAQAIKEIGDAALKHAHDSPEKAQALLNLTCVIFRRASGIQEQECNYTIDRESINGLN